MLSKNVNNKKGAPTFVLFNEKKNIRKIWMIFDIEKIDFESHMSALFYTSPSTNLQNSMFHLTKVNFSILYPCLENSTTGIAIT